LEAELTSLKAPVFRIAKAGGSGTDDEAHGAAFVIVHEAQPELALVAPVSAVRGQVTYVPSTRCWRCNGSGHISVNCPKGAGPLTFRGKGKGRGKKGRK